MMLGSLHTYQCAKCGGWWSCQATPGWYKLITTWCPNCLPTMCDQVPRRELPT